MKKITMLAVMFFYSASSFCQTSAHNIFFELGGPGVAAINYDTRFSKKQDGIGARIGFGGFVIDKVGAIFIPAGLNYLIGNDNKHYFELGGGATFVSTFNNTPPDPYYSSQDNRTFKNTFGHLNFGYRVQPANGGFFFRAAINPIFGKGFFIPYYAGIAFGYAW